MSAETPGRPTADEWAEALEDHEYDVHLPPLTPACKCGWVAASEWSSVAVYDAHVAAALAPLIARVEAAARAEGVQDAQNGAVRGAWGENGHRDHRGGARPNLIVPIKETA